MNSEADGSSRRPLLDVTFSDGVLRMAQLRVDERTNYILRNVLVYEQRYDDAATSGATSYVTAYVVFMSQLLGGPEDVALLSRHRFRNPWLAVAWVLGSMAVLGTIVQTVITLLPYVHHQARTRNIGS